MNHPNEVLVEKNEDGTWVLRHTASGEIIAGPFAEQPLETLTRSDEVEIIAVASSWARRASTSGIASDLVECIGIYAEIFRDCRARLPPLSPEGDRQMRCCAIDTFETGVTELAGEEVFLHRKVERFL